jgi:3-oxoacyl-[acyl-carrier-protein] synthase II
MKRTPFVPSKAQICSFGPLGPSARLQPCQINYMNAHGTGTPLNDRTESEAILQRLGKQVKVVHQIPARSSSGGLRGH